MIWTVSPMPETKSPHFDETTHFLNLHCHSCELLIIELVDTLSRDGDGQGTPYITKMWTTQSRYCCLTFIIITTCVCITIWSFAYILNKSVLNFSFLSRYQHTKPKKIVQLHTLWSTMIILKWTYLVKGVEISQLLLWTWNDKFLFLDNNLPTFWLDALVLLKANEAKAWGTSIYSYVEASRRASLLIDQHWACTLSIQFIMWSGGYGLRRFHP